MDLNTLQISKFQETDTQVVVDLIIDTLRTTNIKDEQSTSNNTELNLCPAP
ncbi:hypothetical protein [Staphylococcus simulans]|uniref:hypothetical protein n=1 Tax=Staphylococcus simulans TaxID=1286 RepID=UPI001F1BA63B|nr:hypothetical protein [Staphylococcus simulans]